jgi:hypothetical protein
MTLASVGVEKKGASGGCSHKRSSPRQMVKHLGTSVEDGKGGRGAWSAGDSLGGEESDGSSNSEEVCVWGRGRFGQVMGACISNFVCVCVCV